MTNETPVAANAATPQPAVTQAAAAAPTPQQAPTDQQKVADATAAAPSLDDLVPDAPIVPKWDIGRAKILLYGPPKIGKSSLANQFPGALFLPTEPGLDWFEHSQIPAKGGFLETWEQVGQAYAALRTEKARRNFKTIIVDTVDNLWILCERFVCAKAGVAVTADLAYGKGNALVSAEFRRFLMGMTKLGYGLILTSHAENKEMENSETGERMTKIVPSYPDKCRRLVNPMVDMILLYSIERQPTACADGQVRMMDQRTIRCRSAQGYDAGDRTRTLPERILITTGPRGAYEALSKAHQDGAMALAAAGDMPGDAMVPIQMGEKTASFKKKPKE